jgi:formate/nitrite transporter FocA (FNT family)
MSTPSSDPADARKSSESILTQQIEEALSQFRRSTSGLFLSGVSAGLDLAFGPLLVAAMLTITAGVYDEPLREILAGTVYTVGFIFVILGRSELFTEHTTLAVLPVLDRQVSLRALGWLWGVVFAGNILGSAIFAVFAVSFGPAFGAFELDALVEIAEPFTSHGTLALFGGALLAGWLMGLLSWLVVAARDTVSQILVVFIVTFVIGFLHLPHSIAGNVEMLAAAVGTAAVGLGDYGRFLLVATLGNAVGGTIFVGLLKYGHVVRDDTGLELEGASGTDD